MNILMIAIFVLITVGLVFGFFSTLKKYRIFSDTPESKIRSAPQGYNILCGRPVRYGLEPLISPLTKTPCCWFEYSISTYKKTDDGNKKEVIESHTSRSPFCIEDETGVCITLPHIATMTVENTQSWTEKSDKPIDTGRGRVSGMLQKVFDEPLFGKKKYYYEEKIINSDDKLHIAGFFETIEDTSDIPTSPELEAEKKLQELKQKNKFIAKLSELQQQESAAPDRFMEDWEAQINVFNKKDMPVYLIGKRVKDSRPFIITTASLAKTRRSLLTTSIMLFVFALIFGSATIFFILNNVNNASNG